MTTLVDVAIGVTLMYLALALVVTTVQELLASAFALRSQRLYVVLRDLVTGTVDYGAGGTKPLVQALYEHPLIRNLTDRAPRFVNGKPPWLARGLPSYIPSRAFAVALIDVLRGTQQPSAAIGAGVLLANARQCLEKVSDPELRHTLTLLVADAEQLTQGLDERSRLVSERLETWFNDRMARAEGWYKRRAQAWSLALALAVTVLFNADTLHVTQRLWHDGALREAAVLAAGAYRDAPEPSPGKAEAIERLLAHAQALEVSALPIGWQRSDTSHARDFTDHALRAIGWLLTAIAVSFGAAFWFDALSRALRLRSTGPRISAETGRVHPKPAGALP